MKSYVVLFYCMAVIFISFSQDKIYFDKDWKETTLQNAEYYRITKKDSISNKYYFKDYYITGQIQMEGQCLSINPEVKDGIFIWYYKNGNKKNESEYKNGSFFKAIKEWNEEGKEIEPSINYYEVGEKPEFPGGTAAMMEWVSANVKYPESAKEKDLEGKVFTQFVVDKTGKVTDVIIIQGAADCFNEEALRVVKSMPDWKPGKLNGKLVKVSFQLPINFMLYPKKKKKQK